MHDNDIKHSLDGSWKVIAVGSKPATPKNLEDFGIEWRFQKDCLEIDYGVAGIGYYSVRIFPNTIPLRMKTSFSVMPFVEELPGVGEILKEQAAAEGTQKSIFTIDSDTLKVATSLTAEWPKSFDPDDESVDVVTLKRISKNTLGAAGQNPKWRE